MDSVEFEEEEKTCFCHPCVSILSRVDSNAHAHVNTTVQEKAVVSVRVQFVCRRQSPYLYSVFLLSGLSLNSSENTHLSEKAQPTGNVSPTTQNCGSPQQASTWRV